MSPLEFNTFEGKEASYITFIAPDGTPKAVASSHPNYAEIADLLARNLVGEDVDPQRVADLFDIQATVQKRFRHLSERVTVKGGTIYLDSDPIEDAVTKQVVRCLDEGDEAWVGLVAFIEKLASNPEAHSRASLANWLDAEEFTITQDGDIVGYKYVDEDEEHGYVSCHSSGTAIVDGVVFERQPIPNPIGAVVEMPRSEVEHDPSESCSVGLHVGTWGYSGGHTTRTILEVKVNPRDVKSVPTDHGGQKMRVCRYEVVGVITDKYEQPVKYDEPVNGDPECFCDVEGDCECYGQDSPVEASQEPSEALEEVTPTDPPQEDTQALSVDESDYEFEDRNSDEDGVPSNVTAPLMDRAHPSKAEFEKMLGRAKRRRRNFKKYAEKHGPWTFIGGYEAEEKVRTSWSI